MFDLWAPKGLMTPKGVYLPPVAGAGDWPEVGGQRFDTVGDVAATTRGTSVNASATANTKGLWVELSASTPFDAEGVSLSLYGGVNNDFLVDLAIGALSSEQVILANVPWSHRAGAMSHFVLFPISIPSGTRLTARTQCSTSGGQQQRVTASLIAKGLLPSEPLSRVTTYGADTSDSGGQQVDAGGTAHTKGAWTEIVASTTNPVRHLILALGVQSSQAGSNASFFIDVGVGATGSEQVVIPDLYAASTVARDLLTPRFFAFPCNVPAGSRLAVRCQCDTNVNPGRRFDAIIFGVD